MEAKLIIASTQHKRFGHPPHHFSYSLPYLLCPIDSLPTLQNLTLFSINSPNLYALYEKDYLGSHPLSISQKIEELLSKYQIPSGSVWLLTLPRFFNHVFNPVSFYFVTNSEGLITSVIAEVTNTYYDKHIYTITQTNKRGFLQETLKKTFHVSPFLEEKGYYRFSISNSLKHLEIHITYLEKNKPKFYANLIQKDVLPMSTTSLLKTTLYFPGSALRVMPRILAQAFQLHVIKKIKARKRPIPSDPNTFQKRPPSFLESWCMKLVLNAFSNITEGQLLLILPDQSEKYFGEKTSKPAVLQVKDYAFFKALAFHGEIGLGESYVDGQWDSPNILSVLLLLLKNINSLKTQSKGHFASQIIHGIHHFLNRNSKENTKTNIFAHYDIGNDFYKLFLDEQMLYSSALYRSGHETLEVAQLQKIDQLIQDLNITLDCHVLEVGSGWGATAIRLVEKTGCKVTTLTISQAQYDYTKNLISSRGFEDKITVLLEDYRDHQGRYDRIISIEMIEAVGYEFLEDYFKQIDRLLKPNGLVGLQAILVPDQRYASYSKQSDWIKKHIFPGGHMPSLSHISEILTNDTCLILHKFTPIGFSYAKTLSEWRKRFFNQLETVKAQGFDDIFIRKWAYYLYSCEAGFESHYIQAAQLILTPACNQSLIQTESITREEK